MTFLGKWARSKTGIAVLLSMLLPICCSAQEPRHLLERLGIHIPPLTQKEDSGRPSPFSLITGDFLIDYEMEEGAQGRIIIWRQGKPLALATYLTDGALFRVTAPDAKPQFRFQNNDKGLHVSWHAERDWATFHSSIEFYDRVPGLIHLRTDVTTKRPTRIADAVPELQFVTGHTYRPTQGQNTLYKQQNGQEAPLVYLYNAEMDTTLLYFQNLTALNPYLNYVTGDPRATVRLDAAGLGFRRPLGTVPGNVTFTINDAFLWLSPGRPKDDVACAKQFVQAISLIYDRLEKPATLYTDWPLEVAPKTAHDLLDPINGIETRGTRLLKSYVGSPQREPESLCNLDVLLSAQKYARTFGADPNLARLIADIKRGLPNWYVPIGDRHTVSNNFTAATTIDSWYYVYPVVQMAQLALAGNSQAHDMTLGSAPKLMELARSLDYEFPFVMDVLHARRVNDSFREYDTLGGYAYVMLACYQFTHEARYLDEAKRAVAHIAGKAFKFTYETQMTGLTLEALAWLYQITGERHYLELSYVPLANLLALIWFWQPDYGYARAYSLFLGNNPLPSADQVATLELHNVWASLRNYYLRAEPALPDSTRKLLAEIIKHQITVARFMLPPFLPEEALCRAPYQGVVRRDMMIPVEDLRDGFHKSALVGQEIYGCGLPFQFAADAYQTFGPAREIVLYAEYPVTSSRWNASVSRLDFTLGGTPAYTCRVRVLLRGALAGAEARAVAWQVGKAKSPDKRLSVERGPGTIEFQAPGGSRYRVTLNGPAAHNETATARNPFAPLCRIAGILGAGGIVRAEAGSILTIPIVLTGPQLSRHFEADLPTGWRLEIPEHIEIGQPAHLNIHIPATESGQARQIALYLRNGQTRLTLLTTLVQVLPAATRALPEGLCAADVWETMPNQQGRFTLEDGVATFTLTADGYAGFQTRPLTIDLDRTPVLDLDIRALDGQYALTIQEADGSPYGTYLVPDTADKASGHIAVQQRTGWTGIHRFTLRLYVIGRQGTALRLGGGAFRAEGVKIP
jgi:hypothetical protein